MRKKKSTREERERLRRAYAACYERHERRVKQETERLHTIDDVFKHAKYARGDRAYFAYAWHKPGLTVREIAALALPKEKRIWALIQLAPEKDALLWRCDLAFWALHAYGTFNGSRLTVAIQTAREFASESASKHDLMAASKRAEGAMSRAAGSAARYAARAAVFHDIGRVGSYKAALTVAKAAEEYGVSAGPGGVTGGRERDKELDKMLKSLVKLLEEGYLRHGRYEPPSLGSVLAPWLR